MTERFDLGKAVKITGLNIHAERADEGKDFDVACRMIVNAIEENQAYRAIGTIDEFKALKEKNEPKKILYRKQSYGTPWLCPYCEADQIKVEFFSEDGSEPKEKYTFCWQCGTRIDWSE